MRTYQNPPLYHASPQQIKGDALVPHHNHTCMWYQFKDTPEAAQHEGDFVFAGPSLAVAQLYACKLSSRSRKAPASDKPYCFMAGVSSIKHGTDTIHSAVIADKDEYLAELAQSHPTIYRLPRQNSFQEVRDKQGKGVGEYVSRTAIALDACEAIAVDGLESVMKSGAQIYFLTPGISKETWYDYSHAFHRRNQPILDGVIAGTIPEARIGELQGAFMQEMVERGVIEHYNVTKNICPFDLVTRTFPPGQKPKLFTEHAKDTRVMARAGAS